MIKLLGRFIYETAGNLIVEITQGGQDFSLRCGAVEMTYLLVY
jgi:hypothetical protein